MTTENKILKYQAGPAALFAGTSGIMLPYKNISFYPHDFLGKTRLEVYGLLYNSIEVNSTFYKIPRKVTFAKWSQSVPQDFKFTFKLPRSLTHTKGLPFPPGDLDRFMDGMSAIDPPKRGCILVQFPASFKFIHWNLCSALLDGLHALNQTQLWRIVVEFRDRSWYRDETCSFLKKRGIGIVVHDKTGGSFAVDETLAGHQYVRFHGPEGNYKGSYQDAFLFEYATYIQSWLERGKEVYVYFNNTMGAALANLNTLRKALA